MKSIKFFALALPLFVTRGSFKYLSLTTYYLQVPLIHVITMVAAVKYVQLRMEYDNADVALVLNYSITTIGVYERIVTVQQTSSLVPMASVFLVPSFVTLMTIVVINQMK